MAPSTKLLHPTVFEEMMSTFQSRRLPLTLRLR